MTAREKKAVEAVRRGMLVKLNGKNINELSDDEVLKTSICNDILWAMEWQAEQCEQVAQSYADGLTEYMSELIINAGTEEAT